jgi:glutathionyl-hydroquinone reductase
MGLWRYVYSEGKGLSDILDMPPSALNAFYQSVNLRMKTNSWAQGVGRHSQDEVIELMKKDLLAVSDFLGEKRYLLGDEPCEEDCSIFGLLVQVIYCAPGCPYEEIVKGKEYFFVH